MNISRPIRNWAKNLTVALALVGLAAVLAGQQGRAVITAGLVDPMSVLSGRSPGERAAWAMTQTKPRLAQRAPIASERVLTAVRTRPVAPNAGEWQPLVFDRDIFGETPDLTEGDGFGVIPFQPDVILPFGPVVSGPLTGGGVVPGTAFLPTPPAAGVPEPATWLMMIVGMLLAGSGLRKQRTARRQLRHRQTA